MSKLGERLFGSKGRENNGEKSVVEDRRIKESQGGEQKGEKGMGCTSNRRDLARENYFLIPLESTVILNKRTGCLQLGGKHFSRNCAASKNQDHEIS